MFKHALTRDLAWLLAAKLVALMALYLAFFAPADRPQVDMAAHLSGAASAIPTQSTER